MKAAVRFGVVGGVMLVCFATSVFAQTTRSVFSNNTMNAIPTVAGPAASYPSTIAVSGTTGVAYHVTVSLRITHTYPGDLQVVLRAPNGRNVLLFSNIGADENWV